MKFTVNKLEYATNIFRRIFNIHFILLLNRSSLNAVGQSIALSGGGGGELQFANSHMEEILRTKWPGCRVDWLGHPAPKVD